MTPTAQLAVLLHRMYGVCIEGSAAPLPSVAAGTAKAQQDRGEWLERMRTHCNNLHEDYVAFMRQQVEAARPAPVKEEKPPEKPRPAPTVNGSAPVVAGRKP